MRLDESIVVAAPSELIWEYLNEPGNYPRFMSGITRWEIEGEQRSGVGTRIRMLLRVGSAEVGGLIEIVEEVPGRDMAWTSVTGIDQRGRWRLRERDEGITKVELRFSYSVAGSGPLGWIAEHVAAPMLTRHMRQSLVELKREVEIERRRRIVADRKSAAPAA